VIKIYTYPTSIVKIVTGRKIISAGISGNTKMQKAIG